MYSHKGNHVFLLNLQEQVRNLLCVYNNSLCVSFLRADVLWNDIILLWLDDSCLSSDISASEHLMTEINQRNNKRMQNLKGIPIAQLLKKSARHKKFPSIFPHEMCNVHISKWIPVSPLPNDLCTPVHCQASFITLRQDLVLSHLWIHWSSKTENWLNSQAQRVVISSPKTDWRMVTSGVPQGKCRASSA